ncbi:YidC/Oxa1 family membrane protein insertase [Eubacterium aggregans]|uniref:YidC/Oxa1 family membrane protein insertase n=2 Tax=Eubacterium aggregans TaxID=81409 RepID=UPI003F2B08AA
MDFLYQSFGWVLLQIFNLVGNYGIAIILFTILAKLILLPLNLKQTRSMKEMQAIQPELQKLQKKYKNNPEKLNQETMKLYKLYKVSPMAGFLPLLLQLPIIYGLFGALRNPDQWVSAGVGEAGFLGLPSLSAPDPWYILPILCVLLTFITQKFMMSFQQGGGPTMQQSQKMMLYIMPLFIGFAAISMPAGVALYWVVQNIFTFIQQFFSMRKPVDLVSPEEAERRLEEAKRQEKKDKKNVRQQQSEMREQAMMAQQGKAPKKESNVTRPKTKPASKKVVRQTITKIPERRDDEKC